VDGHRRETETRGGLGVRCIIAARRRVGEVNAVRDECLKGSLRAASKTLEMLQSRQQP
jgi:hypothetical protein